MKRLQFLLLFPLIYLVSCNQPKVDEKVNEDPLPSWNDSETKSQILDFVASVTNEENSNFIPPGDRIATFDNDGTLMSEKPMYFQLFFAIDRIKEMAPDHPEWDTILPYSAVVNNDMEALLKTGERGLIELVMMSHANMTSSVFRDIVNEWGNSSLHPSKERPFTELVYQPMLELILFLQENEFKTYIVSGGGVDFMRPLFGEIYNIPAEQIIGSTIKTKYSYNSGSPEIFRLPELNNIDDKEGKPENIQRIIGKKPVFAVGNSDGDLAMLQWTATNDNFMNVYIHHTDDVREWSYDRESHIGKLDLGLDEATSKGWLVVDMKTDWKVIYPFEKQP